MVSSSVCGYLFAVTIESRRKTPLAASAKILISPAEMGL